MTLRSWQVCLAKFVLLFLLWSSIKKNAKTTKLLKNNEILRLPAIKPKQLAEKELRVEVELQGSGEPECSLWFSFKLYLAVWSLLSRSILIKGALKWNFRLYHSSHHATQGQSPCTNASLLLKMLTLSSCVAAPPSFRRPCGVTCRLTCSNMVLILSTSQSIT